MAGGWAGMRVLLAGEDGPGSGSAAGAVALVLLLALYRAERKLVSRRVGLALFGLRLVAAGVLVLALFEPIAARSLDGDMPAGESWSRRTCPRAWTPSIRTDDPCGKTERDRWSTATRRPWRKLGADHDVKALAFACEAGPEGPLATPRRAVEGSKRHLDVIADASATDWSGRSSSAALGGALDDAPALGVVLLTDGRKNVSGEDAAIADRLAARGIPVHPILIGSTERPKDGTVAWLKAPRVCLQGGRRGDRGEASRPTASRLGSSLIVTLNRRSAAGDDAVGEDRQATQRLAVVATFPACRSRRLGMVPALVRPHRPAGSASPTPGPTTTAIGLGARGRRQGERPARRRQSAVGVPASARDALASRSSGLARRDRAAPAVADDRHGRGDVTFYLALTPGRPDRG